jgi:hypothetical protein
MQISDSSRPISFLLLPDDAFVSVNIREHSTVFGLWAVARCGAAR